MIGRLAVGLLEISDAAWPPARNPSRYTMAGLLATTLDPRNHSWSHTLILYIYDVEPMMEPHVELWNPW
jgi:hypothetical protein